jgi:hypothetical protein
MILHYIIVKNKYFKSSIFVTLFSLSQSFNTVGADLHSFAADFFGLQIYIEFALSGDVGMGTGMARLRTASADVADSRHICFAKVQSSKFKVQN